MNRTMLLDLETTHSGKIKHIGAVFNGRIFEKTEKAGSKAILDQLDALAQDADFVLGHNLLGHDFPVLKAASPWLRLLQKPVIDTLYISPIAFPQNPYHRLVKNYKLVRSSINSPLEDAKLAASIFKDQYESVVALAVKKREIVDFYRFCFHDSLFNGFPGAGISTVFSMVAPEAIQTADEAVKCFLEQTAGIVCRKAAEETLPDVLTKSDLRPAAAYCLAWLQVAGGNSVLPPWVRHRFPVIPAMIKTLREKSCNEPNCSYCVENHNAGNHLRRIFGYPCFREKPQIKKGESLQKAIVEACLADKPVMAILPTGGGKSLCYQMPALVRYQRRGALTVVISPLQALMKDQVDNLVKKTRTLFAEFISGLQTPPERGEVLERIRLGDTAILYISPESLRNTSIMNVLRQREIGCWIFDEAHCLSKWGHDFRPDYLFAARFIRAFAKEQNLPMPPVACFTATAKTSVIEEISTHFREELDQELFLYAGGVERDNLSFEVIPVSKAEKLEKIHEMVDEQLKTTDEPAGIIVYAATRKTTEEIRDFLRHQGIKIEAFHAGLDAKEKREIIEGFISGEIPVICATNAFGMGIDKENIRLVVHYEMPGSLENYIQEAGRAGRDLKSARCVLLYDPRDASKQFWLGALSEVRQKEIARILRALRSKKRNRSGDIVVTSDELLRDEDLADMKSLKPGMRDTKVKASIAWLERAGFLERNENLTDVFQGKPLVASIEEAEKMMARLSLSPFQNRVWLTILNYLFNRTGDRGVRADDIAEGLFPHKAYLLRMEEKTGRTASQMVITALHDMADAGLLDQGITLSAIFRPKGINNAFKLFQYVCDLENELIATLQAEDPGADDGNWVGLNIRRLNQKLKSEGYETDPDVLRQLIKGISYDGKGLAASQGSFELNYIDRDHYQVKLHRSWDNIRKTISLRQDVARAIMRTLVDMAKRQTIETNRQTKGDVQLSFTSDDLSAAIKSDIALRSQVKKILPAIDRGLMFLHEQNIIVLQGGLAILRQAMTIRLSPNAKGRYYRKSDFKPLAVHYREKRLQVHVMMRYASLALKKIAGALTLVLDYFALGRIEFINKYFEDDKELIEKATTGESFRTIVENLRNPVQISAVARPVEDNMLILAGPGSGKTMVIVHRCAYLLDVERVPARQILVLCFNHSSAMVIRKRLNNLVGKSARGVMVATYHGAAMRLAGISIRDMAESLHKKEIDFDGIIKTAIALLKGDNIVPGIEPDEARDRLLGGYSHILVDEYQDIDEDQYDLVSAIAGRSLEEDRRLSIMSVGDDDQNIYTFRGANVRFIRRFEEDYKTERIYLVENYRSSKYIIAASNALIRVNKDRMKGGHPICINHEREPGLPGGRWRQLDPVSEGRVQIVSAKSLLHQAVYIKREIDRIKGLDPHVSWHDFAVLSRTKAPLASVRAVLEQAGYPIKMALDKTFPLHRVREIHSVIAWLAAKEKENARVSDMQTELNGIRGDRVTNVWWRLIDMFFDAYREETVDSILPVRWAIDHLHEYVAEQRREKVLGQGIFMSTIHSAKGMEFPHVFILDGDWRSPSDKDRWEEERRVMYVGMTRAEETLHLLKIPGRPNPFLREISGKFVMPLNYQDKIDNSRYVNRTYEILGLDDIYLDYAGNYPQTHSIHGQLAKLETGKCVSFCRKNEQIEIQNDKGVCLARLSKQGVEKWMNRLDYILEVSVLAILQRNRDDPDDVFQKRIKTDNWELPVLEVICQTKNSSERCRTSSFFNDG